VNEKPDAEPSLLEVTVDLARAAGRRTLEWFGSERVTVDRKADGSTVTPADLDIERWLRDQISARFPDDGILGEEFPEHEGSSGRRWVLDPIDGTESFIHGVATYSTIVALQDAHGALLGVIDSPVVEETVWAGRGRGCYWNGAPAQVTGRTSLRDAFLATSDQEDWPLDAIVAAREAGIHVRDWGNGYGTGLVVTGRVDGFVDYDVSVWDLAPMPVLLGEAGGRFSALDGSERLDGNFGLLSNGSLHDELLDVLRNGVRDWDANPSW
jgi:histidinol-phosphatase